MLPDYMRLKSPRDFQRVRREGKRFSGHIIALNAAPNGLAYNRFGFVVNGKVGNAVTRNRIKRQLRAAVRQLLSSLVSGVDLVIIVYPGSKSATYNEFMNDLVNLLQRARFLSN